MLDSVPSVEVRIVTGPGRDQEKPPGTSAQTYLQLFGGNPVFGILGGALVVLVWVYLLSLALLLGAAGGVGLAAVELAKAYGARVVAAVSSEDKAEAARAAGARLSLQSAYRSYATQNSTFDYWVRVHGWDVARACGDRRPLPAYVRPMRPADGLPPRHHAGFTLLGEGGVGHLWAQVLGDWVNEIHLTRAGYRKIAVSWAVEIERLMLDRYIAATGNAEAFERAYWALAAQRNTRILGVFTRLWKRDNKPHYTQFQPRMWGLLERDLAQPGLEPVHEWFDANVGSDHRVAPWRKAA